MKIYVLVKCVTFDNRGAVGEICDVQVLRTKEEAKAIIQENIDMEIKYCHLYEWDIRKNEHDTESRPYYLEVNYDAYDGDGNSDNYQWQVREFEIKEEENE